MSIGAMELPGRTVNGCVITRPTARLGGERSSHAAADREELLGPDQVDVGGDLEN